MNGNGFPKEIENGANCLADYMENEPIDGHVFFHGVGLGLS